MKNIALIIFFLISAIFWGLFPHSTHCKLLGGDDNCPPHYIHLTMGAISFLLSIWFAQKDHIQS